MVYFLMVSFLFSLASVGMAENNYVVVPAQKSFVPAESRLKDLALKAEKQRTESAMYDIGGGALFAGLGSAWSGYGSNYSGVYYALGGGMLIMGIKNFMYPTKLEQQYLDVKKMSGISIEERGSREAAAEGALKNGAMDATQGRMVSAGLVGIGGTALLLGSSPLAGSLLVAAAATSYFIKSDTEKVYEEYLVDKEDFIRSQNTANVSVVTTMEAR
ncbi:hypothetical protein A2276_07060 [candidate division WOR-1 bacterium RIFOXYA12_FULL_43_27]|nr:MAG: hypothetical protein A2276_07060 [candidate division WOR-1 bacterium RIFOXYA12_FULL_43_27]OGC18845.1 MAG: hypothetical protein A2292_07915 [candidate division WOR-1 bacterium RIFOXYB2_FULL_46_45]OGC28986.1 MAG: hypothetical protein A2232_02980 [candidate division WOR-1 bacterium RIFOXYA2_FULL_46_56]